MTDIAPARELPEQRRNWAQTRAVIRELRATLKGLAPAVAADAVARAGFHPYTDSGKAIVNEVLTAHWATHPSERPLLPDVSAERIEATRKAFGFTPQYTPLEGDES